MTETQPEPGPEPEVSDSDTTPTPAPTPVAHATPCGPNVCGVVTHEDAAPAPEPGLREQYCEEIIRLQRQTVEQGGSGIVAPGVIADAVLAVRDTELLEWKKLLQKSREMTAAHWAAIERVRAECDRIEAAVRANPQDPDFDGAYLAAIGHIRRALDPQEQPPVNPPGSTREQLPADLLALLPARSYLSTACEVARLLEGAAIANPERAAELREWRDRMQQRCRLNNKYTGALCTGSHHKDQP